MKSEKFKNILIILVPVLAILMQGCFFNIQIYIICFLCLLIAVTKKTQISKKNLILFCILLFGYILSDIINKSFYNTTNEITKFAILFLPLLITSEEVKNKLFIGVYAGISVASLIGLAAYMRIIPQNYEFAATIDGTYRLQSVFGYANTAAVFFAVGIILAFHYCKTYQNYKFLHQIILGLNFVAFVLTFSKLSFLCFGIAILFCLIIKYKKLIKYAVIIGVIGIIAVAFLFITGKQSLLLGSTLVWRIIYWQDGFNLFLKNLFGAGNWQEKQYFIQSANYAVKYLHNGFLQIAVDGGIFAIAAFLIFLISAFFNLLKMKDKLHFLCIFILIVAHGFVDIDFAFGSIFLILGLVVSADEKSLVMLKRPCVAAVIGVIVVTAFYSSHFVKIDEITKISGAFGQAYAENDDEKMYALSKIWLEKAPRQQAAYDAHYVALQKVNKDSTDKKYQLEIYQKAEQINKTMNPLCKYLAAHKTIVLP